MPIEEYIKEKLALFEELHIKLTWNQMQHLLELTTEFDVDAFAHDLITGKTRIK